MPIKEIIRIEKAALKKPRRRWTRKPQTQILPRKKKSSRKKEKQAIQKLWTSGELD